MNIFKRLIIFQANGWSDLEAASAYAVNQSVDFVTRLVVPMLSDYAPKLRVSFNNYFEDRLEEVQALSRVFKISYPTFG